MRMLCGVLLACVAAGESGAAPLFVERLGWPADARVVIFHNDDTGMSHASNQGTIEALEAGLITSCAVMMPCPWVPEWAEYVAEHPGVDSGLHLTHTAEWGRYRWGPVAGREAVPGLVDKAGYLHDGTMAVAMNATPEEVEREIRAQIALAERMGLPITHMDSHMATLYMKPEFFERYVSVGIEKQIPILIAGGDLVYASDDNPDALIKADKMAPWVERVWDAGLPVLDDIHTASYNWETAAEKKENLIALLRNLRPGLVEILFHASAPDNTLRRITSSARSRAADLAVLTDPEVRDVIEEEGIILTTWRELLERRKKVRE